MKSISVDWLKSARSDLLTMEALLGRAELTAVVAFHAQQCVEKILKAIIEEHGLGGIKSVCAACLSRGSKQDNLLNSQPNYSLQTLFS